MTKEEKIILVQELTGQLAETPNVYIANANGLSVGEVNQLRALCFKAGIKMQVVKNKLLIKAFEASAGNYEELYPVLKEPSSVFFTREDINGPAKIIEKFRKAKTKPVLKGAWIDEAVFVGDDSLKVLASLKSKNELLGELIGLLQSPAKNVLSALQSGGNTLAGIIKTLQDREEA